MKDTYQNWEEIKVNVLKDIEKIDNALESSTKDELVSIHIYIDGKYQACIFDWGKGM